MAQVGLRDGADPSALIETRRALRRPLQVLPLSRPEFEHRLSEAYGGAGLSAADDGLDESVGLDSLAENLPATADLLDVVDDAPVIRLINGIIAEAVRQGASDIHVEPFDRKSTGNSATHQAAPPSGVPAMSPSWTGTPTSAPYSVHEPS